MLFSSADGCAEYDALYDLRRKFFDVWHDTKSPIVSVQKQKSQSCRSWHAPSDQKNQSCVKQACVEIRLKSVVDLFIDDVFGEEVFYC
jgi:hypothetical protein